MCRQYCVYILTNKKNSVLYTGITGDLSRRVFEHRLKVHPGFASRYNVTKLVYVEFFEDAHLAIAREKQIKAGSRRDKIDLVNSINPGWTDLSESI